MSDRLGTDDPRLKKKMRREAGFYIRALRERIGLSQLELSARLGLTFNSFVSQVETGRSRVPTSNMTGWAKALEVDEKEFVENMFRFYEPAFFELISDEGKSTPP